LNISNERVPFTDKEIRRFKIGSHIIKSKTVFESVSRFPEKTVCQIYLGSNISYTRNIAISDIEKTREYILKNDLSFYIHGCLLYNLCGSTDIKDDKIEEKVCKNLTGLAYELDVGVGMASGGIVVHFGSCKDKKIGKERFIENVKTVLNKKSTITDQVAKLLGVTSKQIIENRSLILENSAHEGTKLGHEVEEIKDIVQSINDQRVSVCLDTAHLFGAGETDLRQEDSIIQLFEQSKTLQLKLIHLNDSKAKFGSRKDRHQLIYFGEIWKKENLYLFLQLFSEKDKIIE
jgi:endonuclease IV